MSLKQKVFDQVAAARIGNKTVNEATEEILLFFSVEIPEIKKQPCDRCEGKPEGENNVLCDNCWSDLHGM